MAKQKYFQTGIVIKVFILNIILKFLYV